MFHIPLFGLPAHHLRCMLKSLIIVCNLDCGGLAFGVASFIGLGSGLHTFVLYLGPHIPLFTINAAPCGRVHLKSAPYDTIQLKRGPSWLDKDCSEFHHGLTRIAQNLDLIVFVFGWITCPIEYDIFLDPDGGCSMGHWESFIRISFQEQTGGDGFIFYLEYDEDQQNLEFLRMKQVKGLSLV